MSTIEQRATNAIAQGALTNSKRPETFIKGVYPTHCVGGRGFMLHTRKRSYIDFYGALGSNLYGYANPLIKNAVIDRAEKGISLSLSSEDEVYLAENLKSIWSFTDLWKFGKSGTDVCNAALKIARAHTGKNLILSDGYHGWGDDFISMTPPASGVPPRAWMKTLADNWDLIPHAAAVIIEPVQTDWSQERREFLLRLKDECLKHNTLLIFDEIITGFRFPKLSVCRYWGIEPDIILLGKALGGGFPLSAIGGKKEVMGNMEYFYSGTFFGETCSIAAGLQVVRMAQKHVPGFDIEELWEQGKNFILKFNELRAPVKMIGYPTRGTWSGDEIKKYLFWQEACKAGILFGPSWFFSFGMHEVTDLVLRSAQDIFTRIEMGLVKLEGELPQKPFAQRTRQ